VTAPPAIVVAPGVYTLRGGVRVIVREIPRGRAAVVVEGARSPAVRDLVTRVGWLRRFEPTRLAPGDPWRSTLDGEPARQAQLVAEREGDHAPLRDETPPPLGDLEAIERASRRRAQAAQLRRVTRPERR